MPLFDLFGLGKSAGKDGEGDKKKASGSEFDAPKNEKPAKKFPLPESKRAWGALLGANALLVVACAGYITVSVLQQNSTAAPKVKTVKTKPKKAAKKKAEPVKIVKAEEKKAETKKEAPEKPKKKLPAPAEKKMKGPVGSPSVHAPDLPERSAKPKATKTVKKKTPAKAVAKKKSVRVTKPVSFDHNDSNAKKVSLVGMFLVSTGGSKRMFKGGDGAWQITVYLKRDVSYRYQFEVIDQAGRKTLTPVKTILID